MAAAKAANFFEMVSIFELVRDEAKKFRKKVLGARARQKKYRNRQTVKFFDTIYGWVCIFSFS